jgi:hypothetical protein
MTVSGSSKNDSASPEGQPVERRPLLWLNLLCLDAPVVAVTWSVAFARTFLITIKPAEYVALFLTAWSIYLSDRFLDTLVTPVDGKRTARGAFCLRHRKPWPFVIFIVTALDGAVILLAVPRPTIVRGLFFGLTALAYLAINFASSRWWRTVPIKEFVIGFLFAAGSVLVPGSPPWSETLLVSAACFGCLCWLNCLSIALWERELDQDQDRHSFATDRGGAETHVRIFGAALVCATAAYGFSDEAVRPLAASLLLSAILLLLLPFLPVTRDERTAAADLVLLTPLLVMLFEMAW